MVEPHYPMQDHKAAGGSIIRIAGLVAVVGRLQLAAIGDHYLSSLMILQVWKEGSVSGLILVRGGRFVKKTIYFFPHRYLSQGYQSFESIHLLKPASPREWSSSSAASECLDYYC